ncbi:hypothetical protein, partial [Amycolatopsis magusensis]
MSKSAKEKKLKFDIRLRYSRLGDEAKHLLKDKASSKFNYSESQFYRRLTSDTLSADELMFFASAFGCEPDELYTRKPPKIHSIKQLELKKS